MGTPTFQRRTTTRVKGVAPDLRFVAFYHREEDRLNACMHDYEDRSFIYILTATYMDQEYFLYVGKTKAQYSRCLMHSKRFAYDYVYLFECEPKHLTSSEAAVITELCPIYNRMKNPQAEKYCLLLNIDYNAAQDTDTINQHLKLYAEYEKKGLFGFSLSTQVYSALEEEALKHGRTCSELLQEILEKELGAKISEKLHCNDSPLLETNLLTTKQYAQKHGRSREQVKAYLLQQNRIHGTARIGRDWVIPTDARFPQDMRSAAGHTI